MLVTDELTDAQWQIADAIARQLVLEGTDVNELRKAIIYFRGVVNQEDALEIFFVYLKTLVNQGRQIGHSKRTGEYYRSLDEVCSKFLRGRISESRTLLVILSWANRLAIYYRNSELSRKYIEQESTESERQREIRKAAQKSSGAVGQIVEASVTAIRGSYITYEIFGAIKLTQKEPKNINKMQVDQLVKVEISQIRDGGIPKKVKFLE